MSLFAAEAAKAPTLGSIFASLERFISGALSLDPRDAALRAGLSVLVLLAAILALLALRALLRALMGASAQTEHPRRAQAGRWSMRIARLAVYGAAIVVLLRIWGLDLGAAAEGPIGAALAAAGRIALILAAAFTGAEFAHAAVARVFGRIAERARSPRRAGQLRTVAPLISGVLTAIIAIIAAMMALSELGVEIGPLIAGAGIVGLAIGFGAQTLVKDFLTGIFLIIEDVISIGDVAQIGAASGVVEDMSLRTIKLRAFNGALQVIPYGEAQIIYNMTKDFSYYVFDLSISYSSDIALALELIKKTGEALKQDRDFAGFILEPMEIMGVDRLADSGVTLKARIKTAPGKQWTIGREYLKRIKQAFDAGGIEIPFPHLKLVPPDAPFPVNEGLPAAE